MNGYLSKKQMKELIDAGVDLEKIYRDCCYEEYTYCEVITRNLTEEEIKEYIENGETDCLNDKVIVSEKIYKKEINLKLETSNDFNDYFKTLMIDDLFIFLENYFLGNYKIICEKYPGYGHCYKSVEYSFNDFDYVFTPRYDSGSLEVLISRFIVHLLSERRNLLSY